MAESGVESPIRWSVRSVSILLLRWALPVAIISLFVLTGHLGEAFTVLESVSPGWAVLLVTVGVALPVTHAWRWEMLLKRVSSPITVSLAVSLTAMSSLINYAAPGFLGAPAKAVLARNSANIPIARSVPSLIAEQVLDALMLGIFAVIAVAAFGPAFLAAIEWNSVSTFSLASVVTLLGVALGFLATFWLLRRVRPEFVIAVRESFILTLRSQRSRREILGLTTLRWLLDMSAVWIASLAIGMRLGLLDILLIANLSLLVGMMAPVPGGLGVREATMAALAGVVGVSIPAVLAMSVLHRAGLGIGLPLVLGLARGYEWSKR